MLGTLRAKDAAAALLAVAQHDADPNVRSAACHTLGLLGDGATRLGLEDVAARDADGFVRDMARIALRRL